MQAIRSILVVIEPDQLEGLALKRAQLIAGVTQSHLHLLVCEKRRDHSAALNDLAQELREEGYSVSTNQAWKDPAPDHHRRATGRRLRADHQAALSRQPAEKAIPHPGRLETAALRALPGTDDQDRPALDGRKDPRRGRRRQQRRRAPPLHAGIISHAYDIAGLAKATLHVISAHPSPMLSPPTRPSSSAKPSRPAIARPAAPSRPSTVSATNNCTSRKVRPTC